MTKGLSAEKEKNEVTILMDNRMASAYAEQGQGWNKTEKFSSKRKDSS